MTVAVYPGQREWVYLWGGGGCLWGDNLIALQAQYSCCFKKYYEIFFGVLSC